MNKTSRLASSGEEKEEDKTLAQSLNQADKQIIQFIPLISEDYIVLSYYGTLDVPTIYFLSFTEDLRLPDRTN